MCSTCLSETSVYQAAFHFLEWALENLEHLNQKLAICHVQQVYIAGLYLFTGMSLSWGVEQVWWGFLCADCVLHYHTASLTVIHMSCLSWDTISTLTLQVVHYQLPCVTIRDPPVCVCVCVCSCSDGGWSGEVSVRELEWGTDKDAILSICPHPIDCIIATGHT